ncbi:MAG: hypothetical protein EZS28_045930 [Streblomastix strix]|uniref:Uncharacterized protein n=1 Tax=Streblomastix strix TaxID=222440 RepID=A0A5J4TLB7_9EUKA|nr:MAG: hypothetical protein EZS28_045930 [Streblomastix strix]
MPACGQWKREQYQSGIQKEQILEQIIKQDDNAEEKDEQTDEAALNQNKDYRFDVITQKPVEQNLVSQFQSSQGLISLILMNNDEDIVLAPHGVQKNPKKRGKYAQKKFLQEAQMLPMNYARFQMLIPNQN